MSKWEEATPYIHNYRQWFRFGGVLVARIQEASLRGSPEGAHFNWFIAHRAPCEGFSEARTVGQGSAKSLAQAKREADACAFKHAFESAVAWAPYGTEVVERCDRCHAGSTDCLC